MKNIKFCILAAIIILCNTVYSYSIEMELDGFPGYNGDFSAYSEVFECSLGAGQNKHISIIRGDSFYKGYFYAIRFEDKIVPLGKFLKYNNEDSIDFGKSYSDSIFAGCFGDSEKVLVIYGSFGGNKNDAVVLRYNELFDEYEYIDRRVHGFPIFVYINQKDMMLITDESISEENRHYIVGKYVGGNGQIDPDDALNKLDGPELPMSEGYAVIPVDLKLLPNK